VNNALSVKQGGMTAEPAPTVKSAMRTLDILELLARQGRAMSASDISVTLGIPVSSLSYLLTTLLDRNYLARERRSYRLGPAIARFSPAAAEPRLAERVAPIVRAVSRDLNETVGFFVLRDFEIESLATEMGQQALRYSLEVGRRAPLHAFAAGKALLATFPEQMLKLYFRTVAREAYTPTTITDEAELRAALDEVRRAGIARTREEYTPGIAGIARAALVDGKPVGAFSIAVPTGRLTPEVEREAIRLLGRAAALLAGDRKNGGSG
jgi:IclR family acetate operon transcriptional repressor